MLKRMTMSTAGGAAVSLGLGFAMMTLIAGEFEAQEKPEALSFEISPEIVDIEPPDGIERPEEFQAVETPPPPPDIDKQKSSKPTEPIADTPEPPPFDPVVMEPTDFVIRVADRDPQPIVRVEPIMPPRAERSGHCMIRFDISAGGKPYNVAATYCSQSLFKRPSIRSVQKWNYHPEIRDGVTIARTGLQSRITFQLADENDNIIPE